MNSKEYLSCGFVINLDTSCLEYAQFTNSVLMKKIPEYGKYEYEDVYSFTDTQIKVLYFSLYKVYEVLKKYENKLLYYTDFGASTELKAELYNTDSPFKECENYVELFYLCKALDVLVEMLYINKGRNLQVEFYLG